MSDGRLSAARHNRIVAQGVQRSLARQNMLFNEMMASGYPPGTIPVSDYQQYLTLQAASLAQDPRYLASTAAQERLAQLSLRFGQPGAFQMPWGQHIPNSPGAMAQAGHFAAQGG